MPLPKILNLTTLYCGEGTHDKVYGLVITLDDEGKYALTTFDGGRTVYGKATRLRQRSTNKFPIYSLYSKIQNEKLGKNYKSFSNWKDPHFLTEHVVRAIGIPPDEDAPVSKPTVSHKSASQSASQKPTPIQPQVPLQPAVAINPQSPWSTVRQGKRSF